jgi:ABC-type ATPase with predicted acetyltransferase domain
MQYWKTDGWHVNGNSWRCPHCGVILGSNLKGERPFLHVGRHEIECRQLRANHLIESIFEHARELGEE